MSRNVSITLLNNEEARPVIQAIEKDNPGCDINFLPSLVKIDFNGALRINRESVEGYLGRDWEVQDLHLCIVSLSGQVDEDDDFFELSWSS